MRGWGLTGRGVCKQILLDVEGMGEGIYSTFFFGSRKELSLDGREEKVSGSFGEGKYGKGCTTSEQRENKDKSDAGNNSTLL